MGLLDRLKSNKNNKDFFDGKIRKFIQKLNNLLWKYYSFKLHSIRNFVVSKFLFAEIYF